MSTKPSLARGQEYVPPNEAAAIEEIERMIRAQIEHDYPPGVRPVRRDQHPKSHGCVRAKFMVEADVPERLRHGLFKEPHTYAAWIRFSSSSSQLRPDLMKDAHGMAIKLIGVEGRKILPQEENATTHDFVLANNPVFFVRNTADYVTFVRAFTRGKLMSFFLGWNPLRWRLHELRNMINATQKRVFNPLEIRYWSQTPYLLGPHAVKYSAKSHSAPTDQSPISSGPDFLQEAMARHLQTQEAVFDFLVQLQTDPMKMPVEDATIVWDEARSPFVKVATIRIPPQSFDSPAQRDFAENLSFTPWHALPEHRPLGNTNRVRRVVYDSISRVRHKKNQVPREEPNGHEVFDASVVPAGQQ
ncbi:MAG TPA: catalase family protein [Abditibacteriaceae bacterium]